MEKYLTVGTITIAVLWFCAFGFSCYTFYQCTKKKPVCNPDEFEDMDDPSLVIAKRFAFDSPFELAAWINGNIIGEARQELVMQNALSYKKLHGIYLIVDKLSVDELNWIYNGR